MAVPLPDDSQPDPRAMAVALCAFLLWICLAVVTGLALYADGSHAFLQVLERGGFYFATSYGRALSDALYEAPLVLLLSLGVTDLSLLRLAFGLGCFAPWPLALWACRRLSPENFWVAVLACAAGYLNTAWMPVGGHIVAHALFWPALFALRFVRPLTPFAGGVLSACAGLSTASYESLLFLGPPLAGLCLWRRGKGGESRWGVAALSFSAGCFALAGLVSLPGILWPLWPGNLASFQAGFWRQLSAPPATVAFTGLWTAACFVMILKPEVLGRLRGTIGWTGFAFLVFVWGLRPLAFPASFDPSRQYESRYLNLLIPLLALPVVAAWRREWLKSRRRQLSHAVAGLLLLQSLWQICATVQWHGFVGAVRSLLAFQTGPVFFRGSSLPLGSQAMNLNWSWADPSLSLALHSGGQVVSLLAPPRHRGWRPFDPLEPSRLPDLRRYGVEYDLYAVALRRRAKR
ncbi:MAG: hypothetical protein HY554_10330 [Elusimicrobia bacterium]|nr:hypothetical protein [Elusimicrobiota bacterium]